MKIQYHNTFCPICNESGLRSGIEYDTDIGKVNCTNAKDPHVFDSLQDVEAYVAMAQPAGLEPLPTSIEDTMTVMSTSTEAVTVQTSSIAVSPTEVSTEPPKTAQKAEKEAIKASPAPTSAPKLDKTTKVVPPTVAKALAKMANGKHPDPITKLPDGSLLVTLKIEEQWVGGIQQEAVNQEKPLIKHLQDVFNWGIENGWF